MSLVDKVARAIIDQLKADAVRFNDFDTLEHEPDEEGINGRYDGDIDAEALARAAIRALLPADRGLVEALTSRDFKADCSVHMDEATLNEESVTEIFKVIVDASDPQKLKEPSL